MVFPLNINYIMKNTSFTHLGYKVDKGWLLTSQNPCEGHSVAGTVKNSTSLENVLSYKNDGVVCRIAHEMKFSIEKASQLFEDVKRFLWAASQASSNTIPSPLIDEGWHAFILFTRDYADFCQKYFGEYLHHLPHTPGQGQVGNDVTKPSIELFHELFKGKPSDNWDYVCVTPAKVA